MSFLPSLSFTRPEHIMLLKLPLCAALLHLSRSFREKLIIEISVAILSWLAETRRYDLFYSRAQTCKDPTSFPGRLGSYGASRAVASLLLESCILVILCLFLGC